MTTLEQAKKLLSRHKGEILKLDIGCGEFKQEGAGWIGMDIRKFPSVDVQWDFSKTPWPFPDNTFTLLSASHVIEHLDKADFGVIKWMDECWRVLNFDGQFRISCPYAGSTMFWADPTHTNGVVPQTFHYFDPLAPLGTYQVYNPAPWRIESLSWSPEGNLEALLSKRRDDPSYHTDGKIHYV